MDNLFLLVKHSEGKLKAEEKQQVEDWLEESEENKAKYEQYIQVWKTSEKAKQLKNLDLKADWEMIRSKANGRSFTNQKALGYFLRIAAVVVLIFGAYLLIPKSIFEPKYLMVQNDSKHSIKQVRLEDGTQISLNYQAKLFYPEHFKRKSRKVKLEGNAFFNVAKDKQKPFQVETKKTLVEVLGTSFDVQANQKSTVVTVATGKVRVSNKLNILESVELTPNDQAIHEGELIQKSHIEIENYVGWKTGVFKFENHQLENVLKVLERRFHFDYQFQLDDLRSREFTAEFSGESLDEIIEIIQLSCQVKIIVRSNLLIISENE